MKLSMTLLAVCLLAACNHGIYVKEGVTDGDTFYLAPQAFTDPDPVLSAWASYSLTKSACQLEIGGETPSRSSSYGCELTARQHLLDTWADQRASHAGAADDYLDTLTTVREAGFLDEYVVFYFRSEGWQVPSEVDMPRFARWQRRHLDDHKAVTRIVGSWNYHERVMQAARDAPDIGAR